MTDSHIFFSIKTADLPQASGKSFSLSGAGIDLGTVVSLTAKEPLCGLNSLFFTLYCSLDSAVFRVRDTFCRLTVRIAAVGRKFSSKVRSMWRECAVTGKLCRDFRKSSFAVMRT